MAFPPPMKIPAAFMRGGTSKGVFFTLTDLPEAAQVPGDARDRLLLRVIGSPDPYGKHIDGMGGGISSNSKVAIVSRSARTDHDVDFLFGQPAIDKPFIDWSGNGGNMLPAVALFAIEKGLIDPGRVPTNGIAEVRIWQENIGKTIIAQVPVADGAVQEAGDFETDGVAFPGAEIRLEFLDPAETTDALFPTGNPVDELVVPGVGPLRATLIDSGIAMVFLDAAALGFAGTELQEAVNGDPAALERLEAVRAQGAVRMGLIDDVAEAAGRMHTPKLAFCAPAAPYTASSGKRVEAERIDLNVRAVSMGKLHHAMMGTGSVAIATAAAIPGTIVNLAAGGGTPRDVRIGHPSGILTVGAEVQRENGDWAVKRVTLSRSARIIMDGVVRIPADVL